MKLLFIFYMFLNIAVFFMYGLDKWKAKNNRWRISEKNLIYASVFGIFGALIGMSFFHHKTRKKKFYMGLPLIFILEAAVIIFIFKLMK